VSQVSHAQVDDSLFQKQEHKESDRQAARPGGRGPAPESLLRVAEGPRRRPGRLRPAEIAQRQPSARPDIAQTANVDMYQTVTSEEALLLVLLSSSRDECRRAAAAPVAPLVAPRWLSGRSSAFLSIRTNKQASWPTT
jgi:hypothetical protein